MEKVARPFRVCLTGAESTGKTELAKALAAHFRAPFVPEFSREYAERARRTLSYMDVAPIARGQMELEDRLSAGATDLLILDTDLVSTVVYSRHHFGACPVVVVSLAKKRLADLYLLLDVDVPWVEDPVRDAGTTRDTLHENFCDVLDEFGANVRTIGGTWEERLQMAVQLIEKRLVPRA